MSVAVILLSHGSRAPGANEGVLVLREMVQGLLPWAVVQEAFLSFASPSFPEAVARAVRQGVRQVVIAPVFLWSGRHLQEHLPGLVAAEQARWQGQIEITCAENLGPDPRVAAILVERIKEVADGFFD